MLVAISEGVKKLKFTLSEDPLFHLSQLVLNLSIHARWRTNLVSDYSSLCDQFINTFWDGISLFISAVGNKVLCPLFEVLLSVLSSSLLDIVFTLIISWLSKLLYKKSGPLHHLDAFCRLLNPYPLYLVKLSAMLSLVDT